MFYKKLLWKFFHWKIHRKGLFSIKFQICSLQRFNYNESRIVLPQKHLMKKILRLDKYWLINWGKLFPHEKESLKRPIMPLKRLIAICRSSRPEVFCKKGILRNFTKFTGKHLRQTLFFIKKVSLAQVFSCDFCEISKNTFFCKTPPVAASAICKY